MEKQNHQQKSRNYKNHHSLYCLPGMSPVILTRCMYKTLFIDPPSVNVSSMPFDTILRSSRPYSTIETSVESSVTQVATISVGPSVTDSSNKSTETQANEKFHYTILVNKII